MELGTEVPILPAIEELTEDETRGAGDEATLVFSEMEVELEMADGGPRQDPDGQVTPMNAA